MSGFKLNTQIAAVCLTACFLIGCNAGMAQSGASNEEVKAAFDKMPLEERVKLINGTGMPAEEKRKKIEEMYQKEGKTPPGDAVSSAPSGPPPGVGTPSQGGR